MRYGNISVQYTTYRKFYVTQNRLHQRTRDLFAIAGVLVSYCVNHSLYLYYFIIILSTCTDDTAALCYVTLYLQNCFTICMNL